MNFLLTCPLKIVLFVRVDFVFFLSCLFSKKKSISISISIRTILGVNDCLDVVPLGAWIITGGTNAGVMKHVGEAVRDYGLVSASTNPIIVIGVATWGCIQNKEDLTDSEV